MNRTIEAALANAKILGWSQVEIDGHRYLVACGSYVDNFTGDTAGQAAEALVEQLKRQDEYIAMLRQQAAELERKNHSLKKAIIKLGEEQ